MRRNLSDIRLAPYLRALLGLVAATAFVALFGPLRRRAQRRGEPRWRETPVRFHRILCAALRVRVRRFGAPSWAGRRLLVANHVSWLDIPVLGAIEPMTFMAKKEVGSVWLGRLCAGLQGVIYVDRTRRRAVPEVNARLREVLRSGAPVLLFAEATTGDGNRVLPFRSSHFQPICDVADEEAAAVVQPIYLHYARLGGLRLTRRDRPRIAWYGDMTFFSHLLGLLAGPAVDCDVYYGEPIPATPGMSAKDLARQAEAAVRQMALERLRGAPPA